MKKQPARVKLELRALSLDSNFSIGIDMIISALSKNPKERAAKDILIISKFLEKTELIQKLELEKFENNSIKRMIYSCSSLISYQFLEKNNYLFKEGDKGDKFYFIISGSISVFQLKEKEKRISGEDYFRHLINLRSEDKEEQLKRTIKLNQNVFPIQTADISSIKEILFRVKLKKLTSSNYNIKEIESLCSEFNQDLKTVLKSLDKNQNSDEKLYLMRFKSSSKYSIEKYYYLENPRENRNIRLLYEEHLTDLKKGSFFGTIALESKNSIRTASIKTLEDSHFGYVEQEVYHDYIMAEKQKMTKKEIFYFMDNYFPGINFDTFKNKYYNFFRDYEALKSQTFINQSQNEEFVYFIKEGQIELSCYLTILEINDLIEVLMSNSKTVFNIKRKEIETKKLPNKNKKIQMKLCIYEKRKVIGQEMFFFKFPSFFQAKVISNNAKLHRITYRDLNELIEAEPNTKKILLSKSIETIDIFIRRLIELRDFHLSEKKIKTSNDLNTEKTNFFTPKAQSTNKNFNLELNYNYTKIRKNENDKATIDGNYFNDLILNPKKISLISKLDSPQLFSKCLEDNKINSDNFVIENTSQLTLLKIDRNFKDRFGSQSVNLTRMVLPIATNTDTINLKKRKNEKNELEKESFNRLNPSPLFSFNKQLTRQKIIKYTSDFNFKSIQNFNEKTSEYKSSEINQKEHIIKINQVKNNKKRIINMNDSIEFNSTDRNIFTIRNFKFHNPNSYTNKIIKRNKKFYQEKTK